MNTRSLTLLGSALAAFVIGLLVLSAPRSFAQEGPGLQAVAGSGFSYQGRLNDKGVPANGSYDLAFRLYATRQGGAPIATELRFDNYQVMNGLFLVTLDFNGEYFTGEGRWLEVSVRAGDSAGDYTTLRPRQELMPTPYALYAGKAGTVEWSKISGIPADITDGDNDTRYTAGAGLRLDGTSFSVDPKYRLPETCAAGQYP